MEEKKIYICGPSGVGKTTLAKAISEKYNIPFVSTSGKSLWAMFNINSHKELIDRTAADPMGFGMNYQIALLEQRTAAIDGYSQFVTDRSPIDNLVYFLAQVASHATEEQTKKYIDVCELSMKRANKVIYIPFTREILLEDDGARIVNGYYQEYITSVFDLVIKKNYLNFCRGNNCFKRITDWNWDKRIKLVDSFLNIESCEEKNSNSTQ